MKDSVSLFRLYTIRGNQETTYSINHLLTRVIQNTNNLYQIILANIIVKYSPHYNPVSYTHLDVYKRQVYVQVVSSEVVRFIFGRYNCNTIEF